MEGPQSKLEQAYEEYLKRQSRESHPDGKMDGGGRWYPSDEEWQACCNRVRTPSRNWPWSLMTHCRTMGHVARLYGVNEGKLRALHNERRERKEPEREGGDHYYKAVQKCPNGSTFFSLYTSQGKGFEYRIGETVEELPRQGHNGGVYVYDTVQAARELAEGYWNLRRDQYAVLRCRCEGTYCVYENWAGDRKLAFHRVTPLEVIG